MAQFLKPLRMVEHARLMTLWVVCAIPVPMTRFSTMTRMVDQIPGRVGYSCTMEDCIGCHGAALAWVVAVASSSKDKAREETDGVDGYT